MSDSQPATRPLLDILSERSPGMTRTSLRQLLEHGRVRVNGRVAKIARRPIAPDDVVEVLSRDAAAAIRPAPRVPFAIIYEDADLLVIDKPAGLLTSTVPREKRPTALAAVREWAAVKRPRAQMGLIHRLDRDASGLLVFSLNKSAFASLKSQFFDHSAQRIYAAIIDRAITPATGMIRSRLVEYADGTVHATQTQRGEPAVTHYTTIEEHGRRRLLRVSLETGRKHQIRSHLQQQNCPILGDALYGGTPAPRLMLAAIELRLQHPRTGEPKTFTIDLPKVFADQMRVG